MKKQILLIALAAIAFSACNHVEEQTAKGLLVNPKLRTEMYTEIANNEEYLAEFTAQMAATESCRKVCVKDVRLMKTAWESDRMDSILETEPLLVEIMVKRMVRQMKKDTVICRNVCEAAAENKDFNNYLQKKTGKK